MKTPTLAVAAKGEAMFQWFADGVLQYKLSWVDPDDGFLKMFEFPIPVSDSGGGFFKPIMRGIEVMRWIRKELDRLETEERTNERLKSEWVQKLAENGGAEG